MALEQTVETIKVDDHEFNLLTTNSKNKPPPNMFFSKFNFVFIETYESKIDTFYGFRFSLNLTL